MAGETTLGTAVVPIRAKLDKLDKDLAQAHSKVESKMAGIAKVAMIGAAAAGVALIGLGKAAFDLGADFDDAYDKIRLGTGKTGAELAGLQESFKNVIKDVPTDFTKASDAITGLAQRTGLAGKPLEDLTKTMLEFSRLTKTDVAANVGLATRVFGDWSIATEDQTKTLDKIYRASQLTGAGVTELMGKVVQFGAPLRAMNFSFGESVAMLGKWEKEGVNTELVLGSLRIAMGKFAKDNIPMRKGLEDTVKEIQRLGPSAKATSLAMETFGARAGPDMAAAILEGRFALGDLLEQMENGTDTVIGLGKETGDLAEKWQMFTNRLKVMAEPAAAAVLTLAGNIADHLGGAIDAIGKGEGFKGATDALRGLVPDSVVNAFQAAAGALNTINSGAKDLAGASWDKIQAGLAKVGLSKDDLRMSAESTSALRDAIRDTGLELAAGGGLVKGLALIGPLLAGLVGIVGAIALPLTLVGALFALNYEVERNFGNWNTLVGVLDGSVKPMKTVMHNLDGTTTTLLTFRGKTVEAERAFADLQSRIERGTPWGAAMGYARDLWGALKDLWQMIERINNTPVRPPNTHYVPGLGLGPRRALGGPVSAMSPYLVGERGPELFMPRVSGQIVPNNQLSAGGSQTININGNIILPNVRDAQGFMAEMERMGRRSMTRRHEPGIGR